MVYALCIKSCVASRNHSSSVIIIIPMPASLPLSSDKHIQLYKLNMFKYILQDLYYVPLSRFMNFLAQKHRSNLKFSLHGWDDGFSGRQKSSKLNNQPSDASKHCALNDVNNASNPNSISTEDERTVGQSSADTNTKRSRHSLIGSQGKVLPKIKWGDLDEGAPIHYSKAPAGGYKFGGIKNHYLDPEDYVFVRAAMSEEDIYPVSRSLSFKIASVGENDKDVNEVSGEDVKEQITSEIVTQENNACTDNEDAAMVKADNFFPESGLLGFPVVQVIDEGSSMGTITLHSDTRLSEHCEAGITGESTLIDSIEDSRDEEVITNSDDLLRSSTDANNTNDTGESKERFRERLWCFLFENLNRAVDELYLLCELECDLEQMKEAGLVLEEAASDFRELKCRVEKFENLKRSSSRGADGAPLVMQSEHRRPHALSWEVHRMTTSPRRAEILSSSLQAFRKIQVRKNEYAKDSKNIASDCGFETKDIDLVGDDSEALTVSTRKQTGVSDTSQNTTEEKRNPDPGKSGTVVCDNGKSNSKLPDKKNKTPVGDTAERDLKSVDCLKKHNITLLEREREKRNGNLGRSMDAWIEKRNWEDILASPSRLSSRFSHSPGMNRKSAERVRVLQDKLMSPEKKKKSVLNLKKEAEEKHARATRIRSQLEHERVQKLQRTLEKMNRVNDWQTVRSNNLRKSMFARHQKSESRHEAYLAQVVRRAGDESSKVNEVRFITSLNEENKKLILRKKLKDSELRRAEKLQVVKIKQKEDMAREEAVFERKRLIEVEKLQRLADIQRRKEEAQMRREEEKKASSAAREAKAMEQMRRKETQAKARQEEAELLAHRLAERLSESEQRRKFYLVQIREKASMDFRDQSSPLFRRVGGKEGQGQGRLIPYSNGDDNLANDSSCTSGSGVFTSESVQDLSKRRIRKIRQRLTSLKYEFPEPFAGPESCSLAYRTAVVTARAKIGSWVQDLEKLFQARKEGAANFGRITAETIKFLEGRDAELQAARQAGLLDFIASALPASHTSKPEACQVTVYLLKLLRVVLATPTNKCFFLVQNLLPPVIPMLASALETYIKMAASLNIPGPTNFISSKTSTGHFELISEIVDGFLWTVAAIVGHVSCNEYQLQMQDGLIELIIAYQIIHRLRDLFALYDRPQVEGSSFPSSILLGINFLTVLTSKFRESSSIDWNSFRNDVMQGSELGPHVELLVSADFGELDPFGIGGRPVLPTPGSLHTYLADEFSINQGTSCRIPVCDNFHDVEQNASKVQTIDVMDGSLKAPTKDKLRFPVTQRDINNCGSNITVQNNGNGSNSKRPVKFLLSAMSETGLVSLPSMLTAVLLQANNRLSAEQCSFSVPPNFEEVATGVLKVLNNLALVDITFIQKMLARPDLKMEFFHLMGFILSHCTCNWGVPDDKGIGTLLLESLSLLGYFALFHPENQAVLRWGKSPTILHKVCDLPFVFFSDPKLMPVVAGALVAASYGCEQNKAVIQQELSMDMLLPSLKSCKSSSFPADHQSSQTSPERKAQPIASEKSNWSISKSSCGLPHRGDNNFRTLKVRSRRDGKVKISEEMHVGTVAQSALGTSTLMLHSRFPVSFVERVDQFFTAGII
ncbi:hypothetical protein OROGR_022846 [Orobanche gracilis]